MFCAVGAGGYARSWLCSVAAGVGGERCGAQGDETAGVFGVGRTEDEAASLRLRQVRAGAVWRAAARCS